MTLPSTYFDQLYSHAEDPWSFVTRTYEARKRAVTLASLPDEHYGTVLEVGCSIGVLSAELGRRADVVVAMDVADAALAAARTRVPGNVRLVHGAVPDDWPGGTFDLVVISEVGYYLDGSDCRRLADLALRSARDVLAIHWRHPVTDYPLAGDDVHRILGDAAERADASHLVGHLEDDFRLDVWSADDRSVAQRTGLVR